MDCPTKKAFAVWCRGAAGKRLLTNSHDYNVVPTLGTALCRLEYSTTVVYVLLCFFPAETSVRLLHREGICNITDDGGLSALLFVEARLR